MEAGPETDSPRRGGRALKVGLIVVLALAVVFAGAATFTYFYVQNKVGDAQDPKIDVAPKPKRGEPVNILVLGSDRRDVVEKSVAKKRQYRGGDDGQRADTIILVHLSADGKRAVLVHFPRDLRVKIHGTGRYDKINGAYAGGPNQVLRTVEDYTALEIHHYVEVNFQSFRTFVNAVGGIDICVNRTYDDPQAGLKITKPGCYTFDGDEALSYVRARKVDPDGDYGRIRRQQQFMRVLMDKVTSVGFLLDLPRVIRLANAVSRGVVTSKNLDLGDLRTVANRLSGFKQKNVDFRVVPSYPKFMDNLWFDVDVPDQARALFRAIAADRKRLPPYGKTAASIPEPEDVPVLIRDATGSPSFAKREAARLEKLGFDVVGVRTDVKRLRSQILHVPGVELKAQLVSDEYPDAGVKVSTKDLPSEVVLVLGADVLAAAASPAASP